MLVKLEMIQLVIDNLKKDNPHITEKQFVRLKDGKENKNAQNYTKVDLHDGFYIKLTSYEWFQTIKSLLAELEEKNLISKEVVGEDYEELSYYIPILKSDSLIRLINKYQQLYNYTDLNEIFIQVMAIMVLAYNSDPDLLIQDPNAFETLANAWSDVLLLLNQLPLPKPLKYEDLNDAPYYSTFRNLHLLTFGIKHYLSITNSFVTGFSTLLLATRLANIDSSNAIEVTNKWKTRATSFDNISSIIPSVIAHHTWFDACFHFTAETLFKHYKTNNAIAIANPYNAVTVQHVQLFTENLKKKYPHIHFEKQFVRSKLGRENTSAHNITRADLEDGFYLQSTAFEIYNTFKPLITKLEEKNMISIEKLGEDYDLIDFIPIVKSDILNRIMDKYQAIYNYTDLNEIFIQAVTIMILTHNSNPDLLVSKPDEFETLAHAWSDVLLMLNSVPLPHDFKNNHDVDDELDYSTVRNLSLLQYISEADSSFENIFRVMYAVIDDRNWFDSNFHHAASDLLKAETAQSNNNNHFAFFSSDSAAVLASDSEQEPQKIGGLTSAQH